MYVILVYDFNEKRVGKILKHCRRYLNWIQNSVFEGEITSPRLKEMLSGAKAIMQDKDSIILFKGPAQSFMEKEIIGIEKSKIDNFI